MDIPLVVGEIPMIAGEIPSGWYDQHPMIEGSLEVKLPTIMDR
jgi:hypothetical protein